MLIGIDEVQNIWISSPESTPKIKENVNVGNVAYAGDLNGSTIYLMYQYKDFFFPNRKVKNASAHQRSLSLSSLSCLAVPV